MLAMMSGQAPRNTEVSRRRAYLVSDIFTDPTALLYRHTSHFCLKAVALRAIPHPTAQKTRVEDGAPSSNACSTCSGETVLEEMARNESYDQCEQTCGDVVEHDAGAFG